MTSLPHESPSELSPLKPNDQQSKVLDEKEIDIDEHEIILQESQNLMSKLIFVSFSFAFTYALRTSIFVLYCRTFSGNITTFKISMVVCGSYLTSAITCVLFGFIGDRWRFDYLLVIAALLDVLTFWIEATTESFVVLSVVYALGGQPFQSIYRSWTIKSLPMYDSKKLLLKIDQVFAIGYLGGPVIGGIIAYYTSYRAVFYAAATFGTLLCVYVCFYFFNTQEKLNQRQLTMGPVYESVDRGVPANGKNWVLSKDYRFPIAMKDNGENENDDNLLDNGNDDNSRNGYYNYYYNILVILLCSFCVSFSIDCEVPVIVYYATYMIDKYGCTIIVATGQYGLWVLAFTLGIQVIGKRVSQIMQERRNINQSGDDGFIHDFSNLNLIAALLAVIVLSILTLLILPDNVIGLIFDAPNNFNTFWFYAVIFGTCIGVAFSDSYIMFIEFIRASKGSNYVVTELFIRMILKAIVTLVTGVLWEYVTIEAIWYVTGVMSAIVAILLIVIALLESVHKRQIHPNK